MSERQETVDDIVCLMRESCPQRFCSSKSCRIEIKHPMREFASRIESAWRREKAELVECLKNTMVAMCNYCRSTPEAKGLPCLNGCATMLAAKRLIEVAEGGES